MSHPLRFRISLRKVGASSASELGGLRLARLMAAVPDFGLAGFFAISWVHPYAFGDHVLGRLELMMLMEFIILHSSAFLAFAMSVPRRRIARIGAVAGLGLLYTLFVGAFALSFNTWWPITSFWLLLTNRMLAVLLGRAPKERDLDFIVIGWAAGVACYLLFAAVTAIMDIPRGGVTLAVQHAQRSSVGGLWAEQPWRVIAFGTFYYGAMALVKLLGIGAPAAPAPQGFAAALE
jgi:hypothetical protein